jgi:hypothetical protein
MLRKSVFVVCLAVFGAVAGCGDDGAPTQTTQCGDGVCEGAEDETSCPQDCHVIECGDGVCEGAEDETSCPQDCLQTECGDGVCEGAEDETSCPQDCHVIECGDGVCEGAEDETSCPQDCLQTECGDGVCEGAEDATSCPVDCVIATCGDDVCEGDEHPYNCPQDCAVLTCGNGVCEANEETSCPQDCAAYQCGNEVCESHENPAICPNDCAVNQKVDVLFVVDNSGTMQNEQDALLLAFPVFYSALETTLVRIPDLHIGVITSDIGTGGHTSISYCETIGGDGGVLGMVGGTDQAGECLGTDQRYLVDVEPQGCTIDRDSNGVCVSNDCTQQQCDAMQNGTETLTLTNDSDGCPRCRNFDGDPSIKFSCLAEVGTQGCGFEQPLEALKMSLDASLVPLNEGFLRPDALLAVVLVTDEDDCSASQPNVIFDPDPVQNTIDSTLGYLHSFRCFEFGVHCDINDRTIMGPRNNCEPRDDASALLYHPDRYTDFLAALADPGRTIVSILAGPVPSQIEVQMDAQDRPEVAPSCTDYTGEGATPGVRLRYFAGGFNTPAQLAGWAYASICQGDFQTTLEELGLEIADRLGQ